MQRPETVYGRDPWYVGKVPAREGHTEKSVLHLDCNILNMHDNESDAARGRGYTSRLKPYIPNIVYIVLKIHKIVATVSCNLSSPTWKQFKIDNNWLA